MIPPARASLAPPSRRRCLSHRSSRCCASASLDTRPAYHSAPPDPCSDPTMTPQCSPRHLAGPPLNPPLCWPRSHPGCPPDPRLSPDHPQGPSGAALNTPLLRPIIPRYPRLVSPGIPPKLSPVPPQAPPCSSAMVAPGPPRDSLPVPPQLPRPRAGPLPAHPLQAPPMAAPGCPPMPRRHRGGVPPSPPCLYPTHSRQSA